MKRIIWLFVVCSWLLPASSHADWIQADDLGLMMILPNGKWTPFNTEIDADAQKAFDEALSFSPDIHYEPIAVASYVVIGVFYEFFCNAYPVSEDESPYPAIIKIFSPDEGSAELVFIKKID